MRGGALPGRALDRRMALQSVTTVADALGGRTSTWATTTSVWASLDPLGGREAIQAQALQSTLSHRVRIRYRTDVTPQQRLVYGARTFEILTVREIGRQEGLELDVVEVR